VFPADKNAEEVIVWLQPASAYLNTLNARKRCLNTAAQSANPSIAESNPEAETQVVTFLACSLAGAGNKIALSEGSRAKRTGMLS